MKQDKETYVSPSLEEIALENEAMIMVGSVTGMDNIEWMPKVSNTYQSTTPTATGNELENMINDILTVEN